MPAEYTPNLNLFKPGTDDNIGIETSLNQNFEHVDTKLGKALTDRTGKKFDGLDLRLNEEQKKMDDLSTSVGNMQKRNHNVRMNDHYFRTIAHRGASSLAPENTLAAFAYAIDMGFWGIETDIQLTSDNKWIILHDDTVDRTSNGTGAVNGKTLSTLKSLDFGSWYAPMYNGERIPTFEEYLNLCKLGNVVPYIEIKGTYTDVQMEGLVKIIQEFGMIDDAVVISFGLDNLQKIRYYTDYLALGYLTASFTQANVDNVVALGNAFLDIAKGSITAANMDLAQAKGIQVEAYTVDTNRELRSLAKLGVKGITTNQVPYERGY